MSGGSFERLIYDTEGYEQALKRSTSNLSYQLYPGAVASCDQTRPAQPGMIGRQGVSVSYTRPLVDVESDLLRLSRKASKDYNKEYQPYCPEATDFADGYPCGGGVTRGFHNAQEKLHHFKPANNFTDYSRSQNPPSTLRGTGVNRFDILPLNPQDGTRWFQVAEIGVNNRLVVKDNHIPCIPKLIPQEPALPGPAKPLPYIPTVPICANYTAPLHDSYASLDRDWNSNCRQDAMNARQELHQVALTGANNYANYAAALKQANSFHSY